MARAGRRKWSWKYGSTKRCTWQSPKYRFLPTETTARADYCCLGVGGTRFNACERVIRGQGKIRESDSNSLQYLYICGIIIAATLRGTSDDGDIDFSGF